uniref:Putative LOC101847836 [Aplysia californica] n=1 Tax=Lepeophtheirus salmonis TaxID=72036 RepID=A0A0K2T426_LEPSM
MGVSLESKDLNDYLNFLKEIQESHICDKDEIYLKNALRRYETLWIPLIRQHDLKNELLKPPLDIHWMWHLHFHNPYAYKEDLKINCDIPDHGYCRGNMYGTQEVWKREYPLEPYESPSDHEEIKSFIKDFVSSFSYDLIEASKRQSGFYYQVSLPHFRNNQFQRKCIERYQKFLKLKSMYPREFMVPYFDIDFAWHAHMSKPILYEHETSKVLGGEMLNHNDSMEKRVLEDSHKRTTQLWKDLFSEDYEISGVVHRGECPRGKLMDIPNEIKTFNFFNGVNRRMKLNPTIYLTNQTSSKVYEYEIDLKISEYNFLGKKMLLNIKEIPYSTLTQPNILLFRVEDDNIFSISNYSTLLLEIDIRRKYKRKGSYYDCIIPENIENLWGPIPLKDLPSDEDNNCKAVVHT